LRHHISVTNFINSNSKFSHESVTMKKKAVIEVNLVPESAAVPNSQIEKEIRNEASIPWGKEIEKVTVIEQKDRSQIH